MTRDMKMKNGTLYALMSKPLQKSGQMKFPGPSEAVRVLVDILVRQMGDILIIWTLPNRAVFPLETINLHAMIVMETHGREDIY